jgi:hypothetical protein
MKKYILLFSCLCFGKLFFSQTFEPFDYTGSLNANGWVTHNGAIPGQFQVDNAGSLTYPNLSASAGNKANFVAGNTEDVNKAISGISGAGYFSFLLNVPNTTGLYLNANAGDYFTGFGAAAGISVTSLGARVFIKSGATVNTFVLGLTNNSGGASNTTWNATEYPCGTTVFVVVKLVNSVSPVAASMWINPVPGNSEPASTIINTSGTNAINALASIYLRQGGTAGAGTGNLQIDEIRIGTTWESVTPCATPVTFYADSDGDGFGNTNSSVSACSQPTGYVTDNTDCNDASAAINPNTIWYEDADGDGFGNVNSIQSSCNQPSGYVSNSTDCNDNDAINNALATYYQDADQDGFGNASVSQSSCGQPSGYVTNSADCDDNNASANVVTIWYQDNDGDGFGSSVSTQNCGQPNGYVSQLGDCDDNNNAVNPNVIEVYDAIDNDCDGATDEGFILSTWYQDNDQDGFGGSTSLQSVQSPGSNYTTQGGDCNDAISSINPNAQEVCDGIDNNCDGQVDNGLTFNTYYEDMDGDTFGNPNSSVSACSQPTGYVLDNTDCNDANASVNPNATEICDGIDNNCDGQIDNGLNFATYYADVDGDTFGNPNSSVSACSQPSGYVLNNTDCDDSNSSINPGVTDVPSNGIDEDCNGTDALILPQVLGLYEFTQASACPVTATSVTTQPLNALFSEFSTQGTTCQAAANVFNNKDWNTAQNIDASEYNQFSISAADCHLLNLDRIAFNHRCSATGGTPTWYIRSSIDNFTSDIASGLSGNNGNVNLDDTVYLNSSFSGISNVTFRVYLTGIAQLGSTWRMDNVSLYGMIQSITPQTYFADADGDGFGNAVNDSLACSIPVGYVSDNTDCNDQDSLVNPNTVWYMDMDNDMIGDSNMFVVGCVQPTGYVLAAGDCDDMNNQISGPVTYYTDADSDSYGDPLSAQMLCQNPGSSFVTIGGDCNDNNAQINPAATEICDGIDNDCDGLVDDGLTFVTYFADVDGDGFGTGNGQSLCQNPGAGFVTVGGDCNDADDQINPAAIEICDSIDNDCDGNVDDGLNFVTYYVDADNDGFGTGSGQSLCQNPGNGFATVNGDCNDSNAAVNPNATETLNNGIDENCDGVDGYLGIEVISDLIVSISPNPNQGTFTIELSENLNNCEIELLDLNGKQINKYYFSGNKIQINETGIEKGVYMLQLSINGNTLTERIIIQ